jgi:hypothetical protein
MPGLGSRRSLAGSRASRRLFGSLVALEFAMAVMLVAGAGLMLNSYRHLHAVDTGVSPDRVGIARIVLPLTPAWRPNEARLRFLSDLGARVRALPGVQQAGFGARLPLTPVRGGSDIWTPERSDVRVRALIPDKYFLVISSHFPFKRWTIKKSSLTCVRLFDPSTWNRNAFRKILVSGFLNCFVSHISAKKIPINQHTNN